MLQGEHSAILSTFIKLPFVIKIFVLSIFEWPLKTGLTVYIQLTQTNQLEFSIMLHTIKTERSIAYIDRGVTGYHFQKNIVFLTLNIDFVLKYSKH